MSEQPRPMGTVYQPEAAAEAVFRAAMREPREYWVGFSTLMTIVGNIVAPGFMDRYLGRNAVRGQQTGTAVQPDRRDNLMAPVTDLHRVRGSFDGEAKNKAVILSGTVMRYAVVTFGAVLFLGLGILIGILL